MNDLEAAVLDAKQAMGGIKSSYFLGAICHEFGVAELLRPHVQDPGSFLLGAATVATGAIVPGPSGHDLRPLQDALAKLATVANGGIE